MKLRPTLLFLAIFMSIGIWADTSITVDTEHPLTSVSQISTSKYYVLKNVGHNAYMNVNSSTGLVQITSELPTTDEGLLPFIVRFEVNTAAKSDGSAYQVKFYDGTYLPWESQGKENYCSRTKGYNGSGNEGYLPVYDTDHFYFQVYKGGTSRTQYFNGNSLNSGTGSFTFWNSIGENSRYQVYEATCSNFQENNYKFSCEGKTTNFGKLLTVKSASFAHPVSFYVDDDLLDYPATAPSDGSDITISMSYPFITTSLVDGNFPANTPLYRLKGNVGNTPKYVKHTSGSVAYKEDNDITNDDYFCFTGNPIDGFKIYNIGAGTSVNLGSDTPAQGTAPALTSKNHVWRIYKNNNGYGLQQIKTDNTRVSNAYLCNVGSTFTYWIDSAAESTNDNGSRMLIEPVTFDVTYNVLDEPDGTPVASAIGAMTTGGDMTLSVPSSAARSFCTYTFYSDAACTSEVTSTVMGGVSTVYALYTFNPPFKVSSSYEDATWYYLKLKNAYYPKYVSDGTPNVTLPSGHSADDSDAMWAFMGNPYDGFQIINKSAGDSFVLGSESAAGDGNTGGNTYATLGTSGSQTYERWFVSSNSAYTNGFAIANAQGHALNQRSTANLAYWTSSYAFSNDGSAFVAEGVPFDVTYSVRYEPSGSEVATSIVSKTTADDLTLSLPSSIARDFCTYTYYSDLAMTNEITSASFARGITTVYAKPTWEGPFEISADFENAHWYDMAVRGNYYVTSGRSDGNGALAPVEANALGLVEDDYQWAFVGDPYAGFKMFNKGQGSSKAYAWTSNGNASIPAFVDEGSANVWTIKASTASGYTNAFLLTIPGYGYQVNQFGGASGSLKIWQDTGTHDAGSSFQVFDVPDDFSGYVTSEIAPYMENDATYFNWTDEARAGIGYDSSYKTSCTYSKYSELKSNLTTALGSISANVNYPPTGYYRMLSANYENRYIGCTSGGLTTAVSADDKNVSTIVYLEEVDPVAHIYHVSMQGGNIVSISKSAQIVLSSSSPTLLAASVTTIGAGTFNRTEGDEFGAMHCGSNNGYNVVGWTVSSDASQWIPEDVSTSVVTLNSDGAGTYYATLCVPFSYTVSDATAYTLERSGSWLIPTAVEGAVPAGTPVVLKGTSSTATLTISGTDYAATPTDDTALTGTYLAITIDGATDYVFGKSEGVVGFYHWDRNNLGANRAYVDTPVVGVKGFALLFDEEETAIANVNINGNGNNAAIYNMAGQKLSKLQKGINIVNGKKVLY